MKPHRSIPRLAFVLCSPSPSCFRPGAQPRRSRLPEEFFGFQMGADRKLAHWDQLVEYYDLSGRTERSDPRRPHG